MPVFFRPARPFHKVKRHRFVYFASSSGSTGAAAGVAAVTGVGASTAAAAGAAAGVAAAAGVGRSTAPGVGTSAGAATALAAGGYLVNIVGMAAGVATVSGVGSEAEIDIPDETVLFSRGTVLERTSQLFG